MALALKAARALIPLPSHPPLETTVAVLLACRPAVLCLFLMLA
jgi:hypothetical protein